MLPAWLLKAIRGVSKKVKEHVLRCYKQLQDLPFQSPVYMCHLHLLTQPPIRFCRFLSTGFFRLPIILSLLPTSNHLPDLDITTLPSTFTGRIMSVTLQTVRRGSWGNQIDHGKRQTAMTGPISK